MTKSSVITDYSKVADNELDNLAQSVYNALNPNPNFTWAANDMPDLQTGITTYRTNLDAAESGDTKDVAIKNDSKKKLAGQLHSIALEVNKQANGDVLKLKSSGLTLAKDNTKVGVLPKPMGFTVSSGDNSGDILCTVDANSDAYTYNFYSAMVPSPASMADWRLTPSTKHKKNISGYTPGKQYEFKCAYQGTEDALIFSEPLFIFAQ
jgi:hypothetical protein